MQQKSPPASLRKIKSSRTGISSSGKKKQSGIFSYNEKFYEQVLESMKEGVSLSDESGIIVYTNSAEDKMFGYRRGELIGQHVTVQNKYNQDENQRIVGDIIKQLKIKGVWQGEFSNRKKNGKPFITAAKITALELNSKNYWLCVQEDITSDKQATDALMLAKAEAETERQRLRDLFMQAPAMIGIVRGPNHIYEFANSMYLDIVGKDQSIIGKPVREVFPELKNQGILEILDNVYQTGESFIGKEVLIKLDVSNTGKPQDLYFDFSYHASKNADGKIDGVLAHAVEVTSQVMARKKTEESEKHFRALIEHSADAIALTDAQGVVTYASSSVKKLLGYSSEEMEGKPGAIFMHPDDLEMTRLKLGGIMQKHGKALTVEHRAIHKDGSVIWLETTATNLFEEPSVGAVVTNFRDITERKLAEHKLSDTRNQLQAALAAGTIATWLWDIPRGVIMGDKNLAKFLGIKKSEAKNGLSTEAFIAAVHSEDRAYIHDYVSRVMESGENYEAEYRLVGKNGAVRWVIARGKVESDPKGNALRFQGVLMDITARKKVEERLRESEERAQAVFKEAATPMSVTTPDGRWLAFNRVYPSMFGYTAAQLKKLTFTDITHPDDRRIDAVNIKRLLSGELKEYKREKRYLHKDGSIVHAIVRATVVRDESGQPKYIIAVLQDITQRKLAEEMLRESEERFRASFEQAAVGMAHTGLDGKWLQVNQTLCSMLGYTKRQLLTKTFQDVTFPEDINRSNKILRQLLKGIAKTHSLEKRYVKKDGSVIWANLTLALVQDDAGNPKYFSSVIQDITQRKQMEESIQLSELRYRTMIEQSPLSTQILSPDGFTLKVNNAWEKLWGAKLEHLQGYNMLKDKQLVKLGIMPYIKQGFAGKPALVPAVRYEPSQTIPDASMVPFRWVRAFIYPVKDTKGTVREIVLIHEDITEEKKAQSALIESNERFRHLADSMPQIVWTARPDGFLDYYNKQWYEFTGFEEGYGDNSWQPILHPDDVRRCYDVWYDSVKTGKPYEIEYRFKDRFRPGKFRWFLGRALPIKDKDGTIVKWFGTCTDIEDVRRTLARKDELEKITTALTAQRAQLVLLNKAKDEFISVASHQLRTPATGVKQYLGMTLEGYAGKLTKQQRAFLTQAYESNERQINIVNDLLRVAKIDAGKVQLDKKKTNLVTMVESVIHEQKTKFKERHQKVLFTASQQKLYAEVDADKIRMVIENIIDNAGKYTHEKRTVRVSISKIKDNVCIAVQDEGVGVRKTDLMKIFNKFSRLDNPLSIKVGGTGLGLYWAKKITDLHGGIIEVDSVLNKGSVFTIKLPM